MKVSKMIFKVALVSSALFSTAKADSQTEPSQTSTKNYGCVVMELKADGNMDMIHKGGFSWDQQTKVSQVFHRESKTVYIIQSEPKSGIINLGIFNIETGAASVAIGEMNKVMMVLDANQKRVFGCGEGSAADMSSLTKSLSVK